MKVYHESLICFSDKKHFKGILVPFIFDLFDISLFFLFP